MTVFVTLSLRDSSNDITKKFDSREALIVWLRDVALPRYGYQIAHIHVDELCPPLNV